MNIKEFHSNFVNTIKGTAQDFKLAVTNPNEIQNAKRLSSVCNAAKVAAVALGIATLALAIFTGPLGFLFAAPVAVGLYDAYQLADNINVIAEKKEIGESFPTPKSPYDVVNTIGRGTIVAKPILGLIVQTAYA